MKKRIITFLLALTMALSLAGTASASGDSLISRSYLTGEYRTRLSTVIKNAMELASRPLLNAAASGADRLFTGSAGAWRTTVSFTPQSSARGDSLTLGAGAGLFWTSGSGRVTSGLLIDATAAREVGLNETLTAGHRYIAEGKTEVATLSAAQWMAEGTWIATPGGAGGSPALPFTDVPQGAWYYDAVSFVYERGAMNGTGNGSTFSPLVATSRAMLVAILYREAGSPAVAGGARFSDVPKGSWYDNAVTWAAANHIVNGYTANTFAPDDPVTREQTAAILYRFAQYRGVDVSARAGLDGFADGADTAGWAQEGVRWAVAEGLLRGADGKLLPQGNTTRAETATILMRYCQDVVS